MKLTTVQLDVLDRLAAEAGEIWLSAYDLDANLNTLCALESRKLILRREEPGYLFMPRLGIKWKITAAGLAEELKP